MAINLTETLAWNRENKLLVAAERDVKPVARL